MFDRVRPPDQTAIAEDKRLGAGQMAARMNGDPRLARGLDINECGAAITERRSPPPG
ncbi:hypothetical protein [Novosphingobium sp. P6W]|uniref:hypothetical protein n=1 Tax=Novosphingobium sp. P6W TaxID=1609758 RepID=UPI000ADA0A38|nr:hypothetical protein [Novosphingobium sp. P6W]